mmetsp:Transcript_17753/g.20132  ORF Transcript_17753/g.20132 Transcript_17753/m.20132 type:complete len:101 (+) Transcript_17753:239-541(+)
MIDHGAELLLAREEEELRLAIEQSLQVSNGEEVKGEQDDANPAKGRAKIEPKRRKESSDISERFDNVGTDCRVEEKEANGKKSETDESRNMVIGVPQDDE